METLISNPLQKAGILYQQKNYRQAETCIRQYLQNSPADADAMVLLAMCLHGMHRNREALTCALAALALNPASDPAHYTLSLIYIAENNNEKAEEHIDRALSINAHQENYYAVLSTLHLGQRKEKEALEVLDRGLAVNPDSVFCLHLKSQILNDHLRYNEAGDLLEVALSLEPDNDQSHFFMGEAELRKGNARKAEEFFKTAMQLSPGDEEIRDKYLEAIVSRFFLFGLLNRRWYIFNALDYTARWIFVGMGWLSMLLIETKPSKGSWLQSVSDHYCYALLSLSFALWFLRPALKGIVSYTKWKHCSVYFAIANTYALFSFQVAWAGALLWFFTRDFLWLSTCLFLVMMVFPLVIALRHTGRLKRWIAGYVTIIYMAAVVNFVIGILHYQLPKGLGIIPMLGWLLFVFFMQLIERLEIGIYPGKKFLGRRFPALAEKIERLLGISSR